VPGQAIWNLILSTRFNPFFTSGNMPIVQSKGHSAQARNAAKKWLRGIVFGLRQLEAWVQDRNRASSEKNKLEKSKRLTVGNVQWVESSAGRSLADTNWAE
jgi:hypothetical protein